MKYTRVRQHIPRRVDMPIQSPNGGVKQIYSGDVFFQIMLDSFMEEPIECFNRFRYGFGGCFDHVAAMAFTYFFRDLQTLEMIRDHVVPIMRTRRYVHVWDAGCAMGQEPYSLAITLRENMGSMIFRNIKIHATDIDTSNLFGEMIREGIYPDEQLKRIPVSIFQKYFEPTGTPDQFRIIEEIRKRVFFQKHDLLSLQSLRKDCLLIVCKNVLLHFKPIERIQVIRMFYDSLEDGGFFATEQTQKIPEELNDLFEPVVSNAQLFRKTKVA